MKYMLLIYSNEADWTDAEREACFVESTKVAHELHVQGKFLGASPLHPVSTATSLRIRQGKRLISDGPFAETHEQLGGYFLIDAKDLDEAINIASRVPGQEKAQSRLDRFWNFPTSLLPNALPFFLPSPPEGEGLGVRGEHGRLHHQQQKETSMNQTSKPMLWTGYVLSALPALFLLFDGVMKLFKPEFVVKGTVELGFPESAIVPLGVVLIISTLLYLIPQTKIIGAILLTGYLGGAVATHVHASHPAFNILFPVVFGVLLWGGLYLRDARLRDLLAWGKSTNGQQK
ncbi:MAG: DoxX family protein [Gemmatales bacterium]